MSTNLTAHIRGIATYIPSGLVLMACGGGGSSSVAPPAPTVVTVVNTAPVASAAPSLSLVTEGQSFEFDASASSDPQGDALSYSWEQISGPEVILSTPNQPLLSLEAPLVDNDESLSFEVTVSDGALTSTDTVSIDVENIEINEVQSEETPFGTGGPTNPEETVADTSEFEGNRPLLEVIGLTASDDGGYVVHWTSLSAGIDTPISSQVFSANGERLGEQIDGVFLGGVTGQFEQDGRVRNSVQFGAVVDTLLSDDTLFYFNVIIELAEELNLGLATHRGSVVGEVQGLGDNFLPQDTDFDTIAGFSNDAIGSDQVLTVTSTLENEATDLLLTTTIIDRAGQPISYVLNQSPITGNGTDLHSVTTSVYEENSYVAIWSRDTDDAGYEIVLQRANRDGNILGDVEAVNVVTRGDQINPLATTMSDGNVFITWVEHPSDGDEANLTGRILSPNGVFLTDEMTLPPVLPRFDPDDQLNQFSYTLTSLNSNDVMITWRDEMSGASELHAIVVNNEFEAVSNPFVLAQGAPVEFLETVRTIVLPDNRVILVWLNEFSVVGEPLRGSSYSVGFYPVGRELSR